MIIDITFWQKNEFGLNPHSCLACIQYTLSKLILAPLSKLGIELPLHYEYNNNKVCSRSISSESYCGKANKNKLHCYYWLRIELFKSKLKLESELKVGLETAAVVIHDDFGVTLAFLSVLLFVCLSAKLNCCAPDDVLFWELHSVLNFTFAIHGVKLQQFSLAYFLKTLT